MHGLFFDEGGTMESFLIYGPRRNSINKFNITFML